MPWTPLAERLADLPLILAGPILRRTGPGSVSVWVALKEPRAVTLRVFARDGDGRLVQRLLGTRRTVRLGDHLHVALATATPAAGEPPLVPGGLNCYNLFFDAAAQADGHISTQAPSLTSAGVLTTGAASDELSCLVYPGHPLPSFALPPTDLSRLRIFHGSCRKPHGDGHDALAALDSAIEDAADDAAALAVAARWRPGTGDRPRPRPSIAPASSPRTRAMRRRCRDVDYATLRVNPVTMMSTSSPGLDRIQMCRTAACIEQPR